VSSIQSDIECSSFIICDVGYFCQGESVDVPAGRAIDLSNTEWLGEKLVLCNKFESLSFCKLVFFALQCVSIDIVLLCFCCGMQSRDFE